LRGTVNIRDKSEAGPTSLPSRPLRYGVAVASVGLALGLKLLVNPVVLQETTPFRLFLAAVVVSAWYGGLGPGLLATALAALVSDYFFISPINSFSGPTAPSVETVPLGLFMLEGIVISFVVAALRSATARAKSSALENARLYEELAERERELQGLVRRIMAAQEEERRNVAYEVHDGFTQMAAAAYRRLALFAEHRPPESAQDREELEDTVALVQRTVGEARRVIANLRPTALDDFGLATAIRMQAQELRAEGYETSYEETLGEERLPPTLETALFRVAQEALTNVRKHAETDRVRVALGRRNGIVRLEVRDWGRGFVPAEIKQGAGPGERVGLSSMRERVALLSGNLEISSEPGTGTSVVAEVPSADTGGGS
jgi:signal transduction histidine kinase